MTAARWTLMLAAALAAVVGLLYATREPAESPTTPARDRGVAALPLNLPPAASAAAALPYAAPQPAARTAAAATAPRIGSEGYGPHIERAQAGNDTKAVWEAVQWLRGCIANEGKRNSFETLRNQGVSPEMMTQLMVEADAEERRCQTVTARHRALLPELAARAMRAGVPEAAAAYANASFPNDLPAAQRQEVADAMRRDTQSADAQSLLGALMANEAWGLSDAEKLTYLATYISLPGHPEARTQAQALMDQGLIRFKTPPTAAQLEAVKPAVQKILERALAARP